MNGRAMVPPSPLRAPSPICPRWTPHSTCATIQAADDPRPAGALPQTSCLERSSPVVLIIGNQGSALEFSRKELGDGRNYDRPPTPVDPYLR